MNKMLLKCVAASLLTSSLTACVTVNVAPGADKVRITEIPAEVQGCQAVGNVDGGQTGGMPAMLRNVVVGLGGDTLLMTIPLASVGIAYRCAKG